jgi:predicted nucleic acid-binding protein
MTIARPIAVVSDAGPLIALGRLNLLPLLARLFSQVQVPEVVLAECLARPGNADTLRIQLAVQQGVLQVCAVDARHFPGLDPGESAAITQALATGALLLIDERLGRAQARALGVAIAGTLGLLVRAKQLGLVTAVAPLIADLRDSGQRLSHQAVLATLAAAGEPLPGN